jgi:hypothetical protein
MLCPKPRKPATSLRNHKPMRSMNLRCFVPGSISCPARSISTGVSRFSGVLDRRQSTLGTTAIYAISEYRRGKRRLTWCSSIRCQAVRAGPPESSRDPRWRLRKQINSPWLPVQFQLKLTEESLSRTQSPEVGWRSSPRLTLAWEGLVLRQPQWRIDLV